MHRKILLPILFLLLTSGCGILQTGSDPTSEPFLTVPPIEITATPPSTVQGFPTPTLTPLSAPTVEGEVSDGEMTAPVGESIPPTEPAAPEQVAACDETEGQIVLNSLESALLGHEMRYRVYLPPCYASSGKRYPYLIMLHGMQDAIMNDDQWDRLGLDEAADLGFVRGSLPPMVIIMPNGVEAQHDNDAGLYGDVIVDELLPVIEANMCTWNDPARRAIGGLSRGGYWAYWIAFSHPELFSKVGGHSAYFYDAYTPTDYNPNNLLDTGPGIEILQMYLDHGAADHLVDTNMRDFVDRLRLRGINPDYVINPVGAHEEPYWEAHTADYLAFYAADWPRDINSFPSCSEPSP